jgi:hypothetical protein
VDDGTVDGAVFDATDDSAVGPEDGVDDESMPATAGSGSAAPLDADVEPESIDNPEVEPAELESAGVPDSAEFESTGVAAADSALTRLRDIDTAPLEQHVEIFDDVQRRLHEGLAELDDEQ